MREISSDLGVVKKQQDVSGENFRSMERWWK
jgi:hypothetical protein